MRLIKRIFMTIVILIGALVLAAYLFMQQPKFGKAPSGQRAERIARSPNFHDGKFRNLHETPDIIEGVSYFTVMKEFFFNKDPRNLPDSVIPSTKTDLHNIPADRNMLVWFGHSSLYIQLDGRRFLVDPVFSGAASPLRFTTRSFPGTDIYTVDDIPPIDYLLITHDHWDHLDYETILKLKDKSKLVVTGLGTGEHLEYWGYPSSRVVEKDWGERITLEPGFTIDVLPARHFSGRTFARNRALWVSFALQTPSKKIYIGGDSGYDDHFKSIGTQHGPFDLAILECGQYNAYWRYIHMLPEETAKAAVDLNAKELMPVHWSKFSLALHAWDEPIQKVIAASTALSMPVLHPGIGEPVDLNGHSPSREWWAK
jgi:L-ascorbate metabolism protein UlaG (beta-lactamase superfamily)